MKRREKVRAKLEEAEQKLSGEGYYIIMVLQREGVWRRWVENCINVKERVEEMIQNDGKVKEYDNVEWYSTYKNEKESRERWWRMKHIKVRGGVEKDDGE
jgi:hypothetical protein